MLKISSVKNTSNIVLQNSKNMCENISVKNTKNHCEKILVLKVIPLKTAPKRQI